MVVAEDRAELHPALAHDIEAPVRIVVFHGRAAHVIARPRGQGEEPVGGGKCRDRLGENLGGQWTRGPPEDFGDVRPNLDGHPLVAKEEHGHPFRKLQHLLDGAGVFDKAHVREADADHGDSAHGEYGFVPLNEVPGPANRQGTIKITDEEHVAIPFEIARGFSEFPDPHLPDDAAQRHGHPLRRARLSFI